MRLNDLGAVGFLLRLIQSPVGLIPFALTFSRIAIAPALYALVSVDSPFALPVFAASVLTDVLDGFFARRLGVASNSGTVLGALADWALISSAYIAFALRGIYPLWSVALIGAAFLPFLLTCRWFKEPDRLGRYIGTMLFGSVLLTLLSPSRSVPQATLWVTSGYISASVALRWKNNLFPNHSSDTSTRRLRHHVTLFSATEENSSMDESVYFAEVTSVAKSCSAGHKVGDRFEINTHKTGGLCGYCYHDLFPTLMNCCFGGRIPWVDPEEFRYECPDRWNDVKFRVTRKK